MLEGNFHGRFEKSASQILFFFHIRRPDGTLPESNLLLCDKSDSSCLQIVTESRIETKCAKFSENPSETLKENESLAVCAQVRFDYVRLKSGTEQT